MDPGLRKKIAGVTLVELLVVVLILAALSAIAIPRISKSAETAKRRACARNVEIINSAIEMYYFEEGDFPTSLTRITQNVSYFPDGEPACPLDGSYNLDGITHHVKCDH